MGRRKDYTLESLERALVHHDVKFTRPTGGQRTWTIETGIGTMELSEREVRAYVVGLADMRRKLENL